MAMNKTNLRWRWMACLCVCSTSVAFSQPTPPPYPYLDSYSFQTTNWLSDWGYEPIAFTNLVSVSNWEGPALLLDTTNAEPAYLNYNIVETNGHVNVEFPAGVVDCFFIPDWSSADTNQNGTGPGERAYLVAAGDFSPGSPDGLWGIYFDSGGTNIYFGGVSNSVTNVFVSASISWPSNTFHFIGLTYDTNSKFYIDGQLAGTGSNVTIIPATNVWTNGFFIGSDSAGYEQARGIFWYLEFDTSNWNGIFNYAEAFSNEWPYYSNGFYSWQGGGSSGGGSYNYSTGSGNFFVPGSAPVATNYAQYTNFWLSITNDPTNAYVSVESTLSNLTYVILTNSDLTTTNWGIWQILTASNSVTPAPPLALASNQLFFEGMLVLQTGTNGLPDWWQMQYFGTLNVDPYADPDSDGLCNLDEYNLGTNPTNANSLSSLHNDAQALFLAYTNYDSGCAYQLFVTNGADTNTVLVTMSGTTVGNPYQIYSHVSSDTNNTWMVQTNFISTNSSTTVAICLNSQSLQFIGGDGADSDGDGLPNGYEVLATWTDPYLPDTGLSGTPDGYKDPDGDGYVNLTEMYNGTNPHVFNTPAGPVNLVMDITDGGNDLTLTWQPASGPVLGYVIYDPATGMPIATNSATDLNYVLSTSSSYYSDIFNNGFQVSAIYAGGASPPINGNLNTQPSVAAIALANGPGGEMLFLSSGMTSNVLGYTNFTWDQLPQDYPEFSAYNQPQSVYTSPITPVEGYYITNTYLPASQFTNGIAILNSNQARPYTSTELSGIFVSYTGGNYYYYYGYAQLAGGGQNPMYNFDSGALLPSVPFVDGTTQMKQNVQFLLRAAAVSPFACDIASSDEEAFSVSFPTNYVYSTYSYVSDYGFFLDLDHYAPFEDNNFYLNFVYNPAFTDTNGNFNTGFTAFSGSPYSQVTNVRFQFPAYDCVLSNQTSVSAVLSSNDTQWAGFYDDSPNAFGINFTGPPYILSMSPDSNLYGLNYDSFVVLTTNGDYVTLSSGENVSGCACGDIFVDAAAPQLQTVDYYFARPTIYFSPGWNYFLNQANDPLPGYGEFTITNTTPPLMLGTVGSPMFIAGYAKERLLNGNPNIFAYVGQYFTNAYLMSNGVATANSGGIISEYGSFFPTVPGQIALVTMPDPDQTNRQGTNFIDIIRLSLDVNHDGNMDESFTGPDNTGNGISYVFWVNNDYDRWTTSFLDGSTPFEDDLKTASQPDCNYTTNGNRAIPCPRDLEDFARMWVSGVSNALAYLPAGSTVTLSWAGNGSSPTIDLFQAADADGGTNYLSDLATASNQINTNLCKYIGRLGPGSNIVLNSSDYSNNWAGDHYIWCGVSTGGDQLSLTITDTNGNILAQSSQAIQIVDIKQMYERWTVGDNDANQTLPEAAPASQAMLVDDGQPNGPAPNGGYTYDPAIDTNDTYILLVHGWNEQVWLKDRWAETAFKRLYWQGYQGRFGEFRWPCCSFTLANLAQFDISERIAWLSGAPLENFLACLNQKYPGDVYVLAHSQGNVVTGEALRLATNKLVNTYVATQAALSARAYDNTLATNASNYYRLKTPDSEGFYYTSGDPSYFSASVGAGTYVNFFNPSDYALTGDSLNPLTFHPGWLKDQSLKPDHGQGYHYYVSSAHPSGYFRRWGPGPNQFRNLNFTADTYETFAMCVQSYSSALGAQTEVGLPFDTDQQVNLNTTYGFSSAANQHDAEFVSDNMTTSPYWFGFLRAANLK